ncbi:hypothetical protein SAMN04487897_10498 [Paenibacillus sp. yr247]|nr:hypothetical protein SAMN04487897_10498 [Paenibacillus sp. yr247]
MEIWSLTELSIQRSSNFLWELKKNFIKQEEYITQVTLIRFNLNLT